MKVRSSLRNFAKRDKNNKLAKRRGRIYVTNKVNGRFKGRQG